MAERLNDLPVLQCSLDPEGLAAQRERYARVSRAVAGSRRTPGELVVVFDPVRLDRALLEEALAIERACCPFFTLHLEGGTLRVGVAEAGQGPALDAIAHLLGVAEEEHDTARAVPARR
jgi:hypothetical protein